MRLRNETPNDHPIHLHGMSFRLLLRQAQNCVACNGYGPS
ncbi:multicopper oxidase domain-containing protein [Mesorhizobium sp. M0019]